MLGGSQRQCQECRANRLPGPVAALPNAKNPTLDAATGKTRWSRDVWGSILGFATVTNGHAYVSTLDPNFEYQNFSEAGLDEMNVDLVWLLDPKEKLLSSFENDTDEASYRHPASDAVMPAIAIAAMNAPKKRLRM